MKILIGDDNPFFRETVRETLQSRIPSLSISEAKDRREALDIVRPPFPVKGVGKHQPQEEDHRGQGGKKKIGTSHFFSIRLIFLRSRIIFVSWYRSS